MPRPLSEASRQQWRDCSLSRSFLIPNLAASLRPSQIGGTVSRTTANHGNVLKWRVIVELTGSDCAIRPHEIGRGANVTVPTESRSRGRYMTLETIAPLSDNATVRLAATAP